MKILLEELNSNTGVIVSETIKEYKKTLLGYKYKNLNYPVEFIKMNNKCNYFFFRNYVHDLKSHLNGIKGTSELLEMELNEGHGELTADEWDNLLSIKRSSDDILIITNNHLRQFESNFGQNCNLKKLLSYYMIGISDMVIIDESLNIDVENSVYIIKYILEKINNINDKNIFITMGNNNVILLKLLSNQRTIGSIQI